MLAGPGGTKELLPHWIDRGAVVNACEKYRDLENVIERCADGIQRQFEIAQYLARLRCGIITAH